MGRGMQNFLFNTVRFPFGAAAKEALYETISAGRTSESTFGFVMEGVQHHTHKSGALLGAQGIFVVVSTYAMDHGWPKGAALAAILLLLGGSLLIMTTLISNGAVFSGDPSTYGRKALFVLLGRIVRFNIALYLTFVSVILLAIGAGSLIV